MKSNINATDYQPFMVGDQQVGEVHWLRQDADDSGVVLAGIWKAENGSVPETFEYVFHYDETIQVLEGTVVIDLPNAPGVTLSAGDIASFSKGTISTWQVRTPFKKFFVCS